MSSQKTVHWIKPVHGFAAAASANPVVQANSPGNGLNKQVLADPSAPLADMLGRPLRDLRISVTDRCNFRCSYCMPKAIFDKNHVYLPHSALLDFEEITRLARIFVSTAGVGKIRLTGGEPLLRKNLEKLIAQLADIRTPEGKKLDITLTTNASLLALKAPALKAAGLSRLTVSLDGLDDAVFRAMNDVDFPVADVLAGIAAAQAAGFERIKVNMVVKRGTNDHQIVPMARHFRGSGVTVRFIEYMDVGSSNGWQRAEVMPSQEVIQRIHAEMPLLPLPANTPGETATRWGYANSAGLHDTAAGEIGVISSVSNAFCSDCNRARLSTEGKLYTCLFASSGHDLRALLRSEASESESESELAAAISQIWQRRSDQYSALRGSNLPAGVDPLANQRRVEMSHIGG